MHLGGAQCSVVIYLAFLEHVTDGIDMRAMLVAVAQAMRPPRATYLVWPAAFTLAGRSGLEWTIGGFSMEKRLIMSQWCESFQLLR